MSAQATFRGAPIDEKGGATVDGVYFRPSFVVPDASPVLVDARPRILALPHGLHRDISEATYHERVFGLISKSGLDLVHRSPAHLRAYWNGADSEETDALAFGTATHCAVLTPDVFASTYAVEPDFGDCRKTANKANRDAWRAEHAGYTTLSAGESASIVGMAKALREHPIASRLLASDDRELTMRWADAETGIECRGRVDLYDPRRGVAIDLKTTQDARPAAFAKSVARYRYHAQSAMYRGGLRACGADARHFVFAAVEKVEPFAIGIYVLDEEAERKGRECVREDMGRLAACLERDEWPSYSPNIETLSLPAWA